MKKSCLLGLFLFLILFPLTFAEASSPKPEIITFQNGALTLKGELYKPVGKGPFPIVLYNHGSAPGMLNSQAAAIIGPLYVKHGWAFFMPYRRGQGLSEKVGPYIETEIDKARKTGGNAAAAETMERLLRTDHLSDQMAALQWLKNESFVSQKQIAVAGNSFGGIETIMSAAREPFCAAIAAAAAGESWSHAPNLQETLLEDVRNAKSPIFFFQAENDFSVEPSKVLSSEMKAHGKVSEVKIYPSFGKTAKDGHSFAYKGSDVWEKEVFDFLKKHCLSVRSNK